MPLNPIYPRDREMGGFRWSTVLFNKKIDTTAGAGNCWSWLGSTGPAGPLFGARIIQPDGTDIARMTQARRILWAEYTGTALLPMQSVYHQCGNPNCMNPTHLTLTRLPYQQKPRATKPPKQKAPPKSRGRPLGSKTKTNKAKAARPGEAN